MCSAPGGSSPVPLGHYFFPQPLQRPKQRCASASTASCECTRGCRTIASANSRSAPRNASASACAAYSRAHPTRRLASTPASAAPRSRSLHTALPISRAYCPY